MTICKTKDLKSSSNTTELDKTISESATSTIPSGINHNRKICFRNNNEKPRDKRKVGSYPNNLLEQQMDNNNSKISKQSKKEKVGLELRIINELWSKFGGISTASDLSIYIADNSPKQIYKVLEELRERNILRTINHEHDELKQYTDWNQMVYSINI